MPQPKQKRTRRLGKRHPIKRLIKSTICPWVFATRPPDDDNVYASAKNETILGQWKKKSWFGIRNYDLDDHFAGVATHYGQGNPCKDCHLSLAKFDIDIQKSNKLGTPEGAIAFANHLKQRWPNLFVELSTGLKSQHGFFMLDKQGRNPTECNAALSYLEKWVSHEAVRIGADIEKVEIMGKLPIVEFECGVPIKYTAGTNFKLPRTAELRAKEFVNLQIISVEDIYNLPFADLNKEQTEPQLKKSAGSICLVSEEEQEYRPIWKKLWQELTQGKRVKAHRWAITDDDFANAIMIYRIHKNNPKPDGSFPVDVADGMWSSLFDQGIISRQFNKSRWKYIRDFLSELGQINWIDNRYDFGEDELDESGRKIEGKHKPGIATKHSISDEFMELLNSLVRQEQDKTILPYTSIERIKQIGIYPSLRPVKYPLRAKILLIKQEKLAEWQYWAEQELENSCYAA